MDPRVEGLWEAARGLPPEARGAWLAERCADDPELIEEVASLLRHDEPGEALFDTLAGSIARLAEGPLGRPLEPGARVGPYEVVGEIGRGGMGVVYEGRDPRLERRVALKVLPPWLAGDPGARARLVAEARAASAIDHPNLATLYDVVELDDGSLCLVLAHYEGETLKERLDRGPMPVAEAVDAVRQAARGLAAVHRRGIVHRDVKPANVFRTTSGRVVVLDFGIAKVRGADPTAGGVRPGTVAYMAPEQADGGAVDARTDVWALGVVLYEAITGQNPFRRDADGATLDAIRRHRPPPLEGLRRDVPRPVARAVRRALSADPHRRPADAGAFAWALEGRAASRLRRLWPWAAAAVLALGAGAAWLQLREESPPRVAVADATAVERVAVLPFEVRGDPELAYLEEGLASLLGVSLDGAGGLRIVDPFAVFARVGEAGEAGGATPAAIAAGLGAERWVLGEVVAADGILRIQASLYHRARGTEPVARVAVEGSVDRVFNLVDEIASQILVAERTGPGESLTQVAAVTTGSIDAFKWFLQGEQRFHSGRFAESVDAFERAVAEDSTFALAWYRLGVAAGWMADTDREIEAAEYAGRYLDRLPPVERRTVRAHLLWPRGDVAEAEALYREALELRPGMADAWYGLGELYFHQNPMRGRSWTEARSAFERSNEISGGNRYEALVHLTDLAGWEGRREAYHELYDRLEPEGDFAVVYAAQKAFTTGDEAERARALAALSAAGSGPTFHALRRTAGFAPSPRGALTMARLLTVPEVDAPTRAAAHLSAAVLHVALGRWPAARAELDRAEALAAPTARLWRASLVARPGLAVPREDVEAARAELEAWDPARPPERVPALSVDADLHGPLRTYGLGLLSARLGDVAAVRRHATALAEVESPESQELPRDLGRELQARALALEGRPAEALAALEPIRLTRDYARTIRSPFFQMIHARWLRAELLEAVGRPEEALQWYRSLPQLHFDAVIYQAPAARRVEAIVAAAGEGSARER